MLVNEKPEIICAECEHRDMEPHWSEKTLCLLHREVKMFQWNTVTGRKVYLFPFPRCTEKNDGTCSDFKAKVMREC